MSSDAGTLTGAAGGDEKFRPKCKSSSLLSGTPATRAIFPQTGAEGRSAPPLGAGRDGHPLNEESDISSRHSGGQLARSDTDASHRPPADPTQRR